MTASRGMPWIALGKHLGQRNRGLGWVRRSLWQHYCPAFASRCGSCPHCTAQCGAGGIFIQQNETNPECCSSETKPGRFLHNALIPCTPPALLSLAACARQGPTTEPTMALAAPRGERASTARTAQPIKLQTASRHSCNRPPSKHFVLHTEMRRGARGIPNQAVAGRGGSSLATGGGSTAARQETKSVRPVGQMINISGVTAEKQHHSRSDGWRARGERRAGADGVSPHLTPIPPQSGVLQPHDLRGTLRSFPHPVRAGGSGWVTMGMDVEW